MLNVMVTGLLCISMLLVASSCNLCLFTVKFYWNIKKKLLELSQIFLKISSHHMFGYPEIGGDIAFSIRQDRPRLAKPYLRHFKSGDRAS